MLHKLQESVKRLDLKSKSALNWGCDVLNVLEDFSKLHELDLNYVLLLKYKIINNMINMLN